MREETLPTALLSMAFSVCVHIQPDMLARGGATHSGMGTPTLVINQENVLSVCAS